MKKRVFSFVLALTAAVCCVSPSGAKAAETQEPLVVHMLATGDIVPHYELLEDARTPAGYDLTPQFGDTAERIRAADYAFCTVEAVSMGEPYLYYPLFRTPDDVAVSLKNLGYDMICTASNHCADGGYEGIKKTLDHYDALGLDHIGTYRTQEDSEKNRGIFIKDINGIRFAFLDYTAETNRVQLLDHSWAVSTMFEYYYKPRPTNLKYDPIALDIQEAKSCGADFIIAVCHWGQEYYTTPVPYQRELADFMAEHGVDAIIGSHPHVPEPMERKTVTDANGREKTAYVCYSLGNLLTGMLNQYGDITPFVDMTFEKDPATGKTEITQFEYTPVFRAELHCYTRTYDGNYRLIDTDRALTDWERGAAPGYMTPRLRQDILQARSDCLQICGRDLYAGGDRK